VTIEKSPHPRHWYDAILYERRTPVKRRDPNQQLEFLLTELVRLQVRVYNSRFRATGLNQSQVAALVHLERIDQLSQSDLARRLGLRKAAAGTLIEGLEGKGMVERSRGRDDRRVQLVSITEAGRRVVEDVDHMAEQLGNDYRQGISRDERAQFVATLQRLRANLRMMERAR
jgi:DNA-binding MarR family transcriptional regulator